jgi:hypothetical protein
VPHAARPGASAAPLVPAIPLADGSAPPDRPAVYDPASGPTAGTPRSWLAERGESEAGERRRRRAAPPGGRPVSEHPVLDWSDASLSAMVRRMVLPHLRHPEVGAGHSTDPGGPAPVPDRLPHAAAARRPEAPLPAGPSAAPPLAAAPSEVPPRAVMPSLPREVRPRHAPTPVLIPRTDPRPAVADAPPSAAAPSIRITIGRVEVRATAGGDEGPARPRPQAAVMSLDEYLARRAGGRGE